MSSRHIATKHCGGNVGTFVVVIIQALYQGNNSSDCEEDSSTDIYEQPPSYTYASPELLSRSISNVAQTRENDKKGYYPFAANAQSAGQVFIDEKRDDMTVVAAIVLDASLSSVRAPMQLLSNADIEVDAESSKASEGTEEIDMDEDVNDFSSRL